MAISRNPNTRVPLTALRGKPIVQDDTKVVQTASHSIQLATETQGLNLPDFKLTRRAIVDPESKAKIIDVSAERLDAVKTGAEFKTLLSDLLKEQKDFLTPNRTDLMKVLPEGDKSRYALINISGQRREQFFDEATSLLRRVGLRGDEAKAGRQAINFAHRDAYRQNAAEFDAADTGTYWSYGHDAPFVHVFEKMLDSLPEGDKKRESIQAQIDFIFEKKYAPDGGVLENDCESSLELMAIEKTSRHVVSMTESSSDDNRVVKYETLEITAAGEHKGANVYRDAKGALFFEGTGAKVPDDIASNLKSTPAEGVTFRRPLEEEAPREDFRFDWNGNRMLDVKRHDTGWWGHCDTKATIETILADMKDSKGVKEYRSSTDKTVEFSRDMQLEALAALLNFGDNYAGFRGGSARFGTTDFAGARFDDRPSKMTLRTSRGSLPMKVKLSSVSSKTDFDATVDFKKLFGHKRVSDDRKSFADNPDLLRTEQGDTNYVDGSGRKLIGNLDGYTFDDLGRPVEASDHFVLDPNVDTGEKILIGSELTDVGSRRLNRYYYDPASKEVTEVATRFEKNAEGKFEAKEGTPRAKGRMTGVELGREMKGGDDVTGKLEILNRAVREGGKIASDSDIGMQVWNGEVHQIKMKTEWRSDDGQWERVSLNVDATFGEGKYGEFLHKLDAEGKIIESVEITPAVDFFWRDRPRVAPLVSERGNWYVNRGMMDRGVVNVQSNEGLMTSLSVIEDLNDLIYLGLKSKKDDNFFTIVHEGKRLVYTDEAEWEADVKKLKGESPDVAPAKFSKSNRPQMTIPDDDTTGITDTLKIATDTQIDSLTVSVDLKHTWVGDLTVTLIAPDGTEVALHDETGSSADDINGVYGKDLDAAGDLASLQGKDTKGDWKLRITDGAGQDVGELVEWGIEIEPKS